MFDAVSNKILLPPYVVNKATYVYNTSTTNGPPDTRYYRTSLVQIDVNFFFEW